MFGKLLKIVALLAVAIVGLAIYTDYAPTSRVALMVTRVRENLPALLVRKNLRGSDVVEFGKSVAEQAERDEVRQSGKAVVYKWRDSNGNWTYGNSPPPGVQATAEQLDVKKTNRSSQ